MKCRYDLNKKCTEDCKHINTCAWVKDASRRAKVGKSERNGKATRNGK